jgi:hypothetical protein
MSAWQVFFVVMAGFSFLVPTVYYWLGIPEATAGQLIWSLVVGIVAVGVVAFLLALGLLRDWRQALRRTHWVSFFAFGFLLWVALCLWWEPYLMELGRWMAAALTAMLRRPVEPDLFARGVSALTLIYVSFVALAPMAAWLALGRRAAWGMSLGYWGKGAAFVLVGLVAPFWIFAWVPGLTGTALEVASFTVRTLAALALAAGAWVWFAQVVRREVE